MIFFYVGIGLAMMTTVLGIFETSITLNKNNYTTKSKAINEDKLILQRQQDKKFLQMLNDIKGRSLGSDQVLCQNIKNGFVDQFDPNYTILSKYSILNNYTSGIPSNTSHIRLKNGCDLINGSHRVVIVPSSIESNTYNLYSCIIDIEPKCPFELVN
tara:strand:+ start:752 stop:1222 length:471 start_codon:yes stop_codon:yes gene_type:complete